MIEVFIEVIQVANAIREVVDIYTIIYSVRESLRVGILRRLPPKRDEGNPLRILEVAETGLIPVLADGFVKEVEIAFNEASWIETMQSMLLPAHPKFDILSARPGQLKTFCYDTIGNYDFRGLRGDRSTHSGLLSRDLGRHLARAQTEVVFNMVEKESIPSDSSRIGKLSYRVEKTIEAMKEDGLKPSVIALPWSLDIDVVNRLGMNLNFESTRGRPETCFVVFKDKAFGLTVIREPQVSEGGLYIIDLEGFCRIRFYRDKLLECSWYTRPSYDDDHLGFLAKMHYEVTLKNAAAARRILTSEQPGGADG